MFALVSNITCIFDISLLLIISVIHLWWIHRLAIFILFFCWFYSQLIKQSQSKYSISIIFYDHNRCNLSFMKIFFPGLVHLFIFNITISWPFCDIYRYELNSWIQNQHITEYIPHCHWFYAKYHVHRIAPPLSPI